MVHASEEVGEAGVGAQGVELRVDAEPDDPHVADGEGAVELVERAATASSKSPAQRSVQLSRR